MIDTSTGILILDGATRVDPSLTRSAFLASPLGASADVIPGWAGQVSYYAGVHGIGGNDCAVTLLFEGERLARLDLGLHPPDVSHDDYDVDAALARKAHHDAWLASMLGPPPYEYPWGVIHSSYDPRSVSSAVFVRYTARS